MAINAGYFAVKWLRLGVFKEEEPKLNGWQLLELCFAGGLSAQVVRHHSTAGGFLAKVFFSASFQVLTSGSRQHSCGNKSIHSRCLKLICIKFLIICKRSSARVSIQTRGHRFSSFECWGRFVDGLVSSLMCY